MQEGFCCAKFRQLEVIVMFRYGYKLKLKYHESRKYSFTVVVVTATAFLLALGSDVGSSPTAGQIDGDFSAFSSISSDKCRHSTYTNALDAKCRRDTYDRSNIILFPRRVYAEEILHNFNSFLVCLGIHVSWISWGSNPPSSL